MNIKEGNTNPIEPVDDKPIKVVNNKPIDDKPPHVGSADTVFPLSRVRTIMKSSQDTGQITNDVLFVMTRCTELFVQHLAKEAYEVMKKNASNVVKYEHLSQLVNEKEHLEFLLQIIPEKITVKEFKEILRNSGASESSESTDESSDNSDNS